MRATVTRGQYQRRSHGMVRTGRSRATAIWVTCSATGQPTREGCAIASTPRLCASCRSSTWSVKATAPTASYSRTPTTRGVQDDERQKRKGHPGWWLLLGDAGSHPQAARRDLDQG